MAKIKSVEPNIADLANGWMKSYKLDYKLEQESLNTEIDQALNDYYSKNGGVGGNRPDAKLLLQDKNLVDYPILIEYKGYKDKLVMLDADGKVANKTAKNQPDFKIINSYAVNGAVHYANALLHYTSYTDIIAVGMTGYKNDNGKLEYEIGVYYVSKSNFGIGQKIDDYTDFSFLKKSNFDGFIEKVRRLQLSQEEIEKLKEHREQEINASLVIKLGDLFDVLPYKKRFDANKVSLVENGGHPYIVRQSTDNGKKGNIDESVSFLNPGNTISFGQDTATMFYQEVPYFTSDKIKILKPKDAEFSKKNAQFFLSSMRKTFSSFAWGSSRFNVETLKEQLIMFPITNHGKIDFTFMESFIADLEEERVAKLSTFLTVSGLDNYELSIEEKDALKNYTSLKWDAYNLEKLFGKSTRGKRLKGDDRIAGTLPFVTAGETAEGISAYISNHVEVFEKNTTTIDMFGSAKYRNYQYGADDHVAVVHTESVPMKASIFLTSAIHKAAHTGKFDYGHNFYAKDADALDIMLPTKDGKPDYDAMATLISAVQKLVIQDVVIYADKRI